MQSVAMDVNSISHHKMRAELLGLFSFTRLILESFDYQTAYLYAEASFEESPDIVLATEVFYRMPDYHLQEQMATHFLCLYEERKEIFLATVPDKEVGCDDVVLSLFPCESGDQVKGILRSVICDEMLRIQDGSHFLVPWEQEANRIILELKKDRGGSFNRPLERTIEEER